MTQRTVIVYLAGDNNLSGEIEAKISSISKGFRAVDGSRNKMAIFADCRSEPPRLMEVTAEGPEIIKTYPSLNSADPRVLESVIADITEIFPSESYGLICFSHASGWLPEGALADPENYGTDPSGVSPASVFQDNGIEMSLKDFADAIILPGGEKYDFLLIEACYMAGIEVAYELKDVARSMIASSAEILSPGFQDCYENRLHLLFEPEADVIGFAEAYFDYWNAMQGASRSATVSVIDLTAVDALAGEVARLLDEGKYLISDPSGIQHFNRNHYRLFFDLTEYLEAVMGEEAPYAMDRYRTLLKKTVPYCNATPSFMTGYPYSFNIRTSCGLTTYIMQPGLERLNEDYERSTYCIFVKKQQLS